MKTGIVTTLIALCLPVSVFATTLRLSTDVDLLVLAFRGVELTVNSETELDVGGVIFAEPKLHVAYYLSFLFISFRR